MYGKAYCMSMHLLDKYIIVQIVQIELLGPA